jgi:putative ABC transport system permease protein
MRLPRRPKEQDLEDEIQAHLAIETRQRIERGEAPEDAAVAARREFGSVALVKEVTRSIGGFGWMDSLLQDLKYAGRTMRKTPGFTAIAIATLALGIGANTAIFSIVDTAMLRPLPFQDSDRLVRVWKTRAGKILGGWSPMDIRDFAAAAHSFDGMVSYDRWRKNVSLSQGSSQPEALVVGLVPSAYFDVLRIRPILGRVFTPEENQYGKHFVAAISEGLWHTRFASDPDVIGRTLRINGESYQIVGVMPQVVPTWMHNTAVPIGVWTPFTSLNMWTEAARGGTGDSSIGRLRPGVSIEQARSEIAGIAARLSTEHPVLQGLGATIEPLADTRAGPIRPILFMLCGAVSLVLLIACANLAGLLMARNSARYREIAMRAALGASRPRLIRQLLIETVALSLAGGLAGLGVAAGMGAVLVRSNAQGTAPYISSSKWLPQFWAPDGRILLFAFAISILTALCFGLGPAFGGTQVSLASTLREGGRSGSVGAGRQAFRRAMVVAEIALSLVLVIAAALLVQTMIKLQRQDPGFRGDHLFTAHIFVPPARYTDPADIARFCDQLGLRVRAIPGVIDASVTGVYPTDMHKWSEMFTFDGHAASRLADIPQARFGPVDDRFVRTIGLSLVSGRDFAESDQATSPPVALVNQEFVHRYFPNENPVGRQFRMGPPRGIAVPLEAGRGGYWKRGSGAVRIVGVLANFMNERPPIPPSPQILLLYRQQPDVNFGVKDVVVRTSVQPETIASAVSRELHALDPEIPLGEISTMERHLADQTADSRFTTVLLGLFAVLGMILAIIGVYGVVSYLVAQRTHELGVRVALGASAADILWLVLRHGITIGLLGVGLGLAGALAAREILAGMLYNVSASDPWTLGCGSIILLVVVLIATAIPARRAMRVDPVLALRSE